LVEEWTRGRIVRREPLRGLWLSKFLKRRGKGKFRKGGKDLLERAMPCWGGEGEVRDKQSSYWKPLFIMKESSWGGEGKERKKNKRGGPSQSAPTPHDHWERTREKMWEGRSGKNSIPRRE